MAEPSPTLMRVRLHRITSAISLINATPTLEVMNALDDLIPAFLTALSKEQTRLKKLLPTETAHA